MTPLLLLVLLDGLTTDLNSKETASSGVNLQPPVDDLVESLCRPSLSSGLDLVIIDSPPKFLGRVRVAAVPRYSCPVGLSTPLSAMLRRYIRMSDFKVSLVLRRRTCEWNQVNTCITSSVRYV